MFMRTILIAGILAGGTAAIALADNDKLAMGSAPAGQVAGQLQSQGFSVSKIKPDDGGYKVKGVNAYGQKEKLHVSPNGTVTSKGDD